MGSGRKSLTLKESIVILRKYLLSPEEDVANKNKRKNNVKENSVTNKRSKTNGTDVIDAVFNSVALRHNLLYQHFIDMNFNDFAESRR